MKTVELTLNEEEAKRVVIFLGKASQHYLDKGLVNIGKDVDRIRGKIEQQRKKSLATNQE